METMQRAIVNGRWDILGPVINEYDDRDVVQTEGVSFNPRDRGGFFVSCPVASLADTPSEVVACDDCQRLCGGHLASGFRFDRID